MASKYSMERLCGVEEEVVWRNWDANAMAIGRIFMFQCLKGRIERIYKIWIWYEVLKGEWENS